MTTPRIKKKGIFFTLIAMSVMAIFILVFTPQAEISLQKDEQATVEKINNVNDFVNKLENSYLENVLRTTTYRTLLSLIFYINSTGSFIPNLDSAFSEVMITGTINGVPIDTLTGKNIMSNNTLTDWASRLSETAKDTFNIDTTIIINNASITQTKPWSVDPTLSANFSVRSNVAEWKRSVTIKSSLSIEGFHDPYYLVNTHRAYTNQIKKSSLQFDQWNVSQVREHLRNGTYVHWENSDAPSFLARFNNSINASVCCGIESLVDSNKISPSDQIESYVDYLFWTNKFNGQCSQLYNITNPSTGGGLWDEFRFFKLDLIHVAEYNITDKDSVRTC